MSSKKQRFEKWLRIVGHPKPSHTHACVYTAVYIAHSDILISKHAFAAIESQNLS